MTTFEEAMALFDATYNDNQPSTPESIFGGAITNDTSVPPYTDSQDVLPCTNNQDILPYTDNQDALSYTDDGEASSFTYTDDLNALPYTDSQDTLSYADSTNALSYADNQNTFSYTDDLNAVPYTEKVDTPPATYTSVENINNILPTPIPTPVQSPCPIRVNNKKRKASAGSSGGESTKKVKKEIPPKTVATGFLADGAWVVDAKFACVNCRRGHRANTCTDGMKGAPVQLVATAGRPRKEELKVPTKCTCGPNLCQCRHPSYLLEEVWVGSEKKWKILGPVISNGKAQTVPCDASCSRGN